MTPETISIEALSSASASCRIFLRSAIPARYVAFPETNVCRDAEVFPASGVLFVSAPTRIILSIEIESASARICVITVFEP